MHVLAGTDARTCGDGCTYLRGRLHILAGRMQCTARTDAVHCGNGCSALRLRWVKLTPKSPVLFYKCQTTTQSIFRITFATEDANVWVEMAFLPGDSG